MLIKNYAIEEARRNPELIAVGLHPGTVDTALSEPFQKNVPSGQLFNPDQSANYLLDVIEKLTPDQSGKVFDWGGQENRVLSPRKTNTHAYCSESAACSIFFAAA